MDGQKVTLLIPKLAHNVCCVACICHLQVVAGEEASLHIARQFCADLKMLFPSLHVIAVESNRLLALTEPLGRR